MVSSVEKKKNFHVQEGEVETFNFLLEAIHFSEVFLDPFAALFVFI